LPYAYSNPVSGIFTQPKGLHSFKITDEFSQNYGKNNPYFSISDYQKGRNTRGINNDSPSYPILGGSQERRYRGNLSGNLSENRFRTIKHLRQRNN
jgi:hypothetical protein